MITQSFLVQVVQKSYDLGSEQAINRGRKKKEKVDNGFFT